VWMLECNNIPGVGHLVGCSFSVEVGNAFGFYDQVGWDMLY